MNVVVPGVAVAAAVVVALLGWRLRVRQLTRRWEGALAAARHEAMHDGLTGALARAAFTEEALVRDYAELQLALAPLVERGVRIAVDDTGAGYSGLRNAIDLHPAYLKLDRALVSGIDRDPKRAALVDALLRYAQHAGSHIVAEGVETEGELEALTRLGVPLAQGFLLGRPGSPWPRLERRPAGASQPQHAPAGAAHDVVAVDLTIRDLLDAAGAQAGERSLAGGGAW